MSKEVKSGSLPSALPILGGCVWEIFLLVFLSCSVKTPESILAKKEMAKALTEFYLKESKISNFHVGQDSAMVLFEYFRQQYAEQNNFNDSIIDKSYRYYLDHPEELNVIYDMIIDSLSLKEQRALVPVGQPK